MKKSISLFLLFLISLASFGEIIHPITWHFSTKEISATEKQLIFSATIEQGWHLYGIDLPEGGPVATTFSFNTTKGVKLLGKVKAEHSPKVKYDKQFDMDLNWYDSNINFIQNIEITDNDYQINGEVRYMCCNDVTCLPPTPESFSFTGNKGISENDSNQLTTGSSNESDASADTESVVVQPESTPKTQKVSKGSNPLWTPVIKQLEQYGHESALQDSSLWMILLTGFIGGLLALLTPCVWPMIPMTVSFFLKRTKSRKKSIADAITYGLSIIIIYVSLGLIITGFFGASALNDMSTNAVFNILFFLLLVLFAVSFFGAFEITLPSSWTTKLDNKADTTTGLLSIFFMAFTLALVSFSCTGPIIGTLLVQAASTGVSLAPALGMLGFAIALAIPFSLFAIFPSMLHSMPKSGGWLNSVKVVLGFLELALSLKFLSVADLAYGWHLLDREAFVTLWIIIFALLGFYLLGKIRFKNDSELTYVPVSRLFLAIISLAFAMYMVPGLWGAPLKAISAFAPPLKTQDFNLYEEEIKNTFNDFDEGMAYAQEVGKPVLLDFSGYGCVNCRKMEASVWTNPLVKSMIEKNYVLITLYVDDKTPLEKPMRIEEYGKKRTLTTVGDKWSYLQRHKFGANAQPFYVLLNTKGEPIGPAYSYNESITDYLKFLHTGIRNFKK